MCPRATLCSLPMEGDGFLRMFEGAQYRASEPMHMGDDADDLFVDAKRRRVYVSCGDGFLDVFDADAYQIIERIPTIKGARTSLLVPEIDRLFVAARATADAPAAVWVFRPGPLP